MILQELRQTITRDDSLSREHDGAGHGKHGEQVDDGHVKAERRQLQQFQRPVEPEAAHLRGDRTRQTAMGDLHAFRAASRPGCVDDVGNIGDLRKRPLHGGRGIHHGGGVNDRQEPKTLLVRGVGDHGNRSRVLDHEGDPLVRLGRIDRQVGRTRAAHRQNGHNGVDVLRQADRHHDPGAGAQGAEPAGQGLDARVQVGVGDGLCPLLDRDARGTRRHSVIEELDETHRFRAGLTNTPCGDLLDDVGWNHVQLTHRSIGPRAGLSGELTPGLAEVAGTCLVVDIPRELHLNLGAAVRAVEQAEVEVELRRAQVEVGDCRGGNPEVKVDVVALPGRHTDLEHRVPVHGAGRVEVLHQHIEGQVGVFQSVQCRVAHVIAQLSKGGGGGDAMAHHQGVDEQPHQVSKSFLIAASDLRAEYDVVDTETTHQGGHQCLVQHVGGASQVTFQVTQPVAEGRGNGHEHTRSPARGDGWTGSRQRQLGVLRGVGQPGAPVLGLFVGE